MDDTDRKLISLLRADARQPIASLSAALGVSRSTVKARIDRLVESGTIQGFTVLLSADVAPASVRAVTMVEVESRSTERVISQLRGFPEVRSLQTTNGRWDIIMVIETASLAEFDDVLRQIQRRSGVARTETNILLSAHKGDAGLSL